MMVTATRRRTTLKYGVKPGSHIPSARAQAYGEFLQDLADEHDGRLDAEMVVHAARDPSSTIHNHFEWDDSVAAEEHRKQQARELLRFIVYVEDDTGKEVRAFMNVEVQVPDPGEGTNAYYVPTPTVLSDSHLMAQAFQEALDYLGWFRRKYALLKELSHVHAAIDHVLTKASRNGSSRSHIKQ